MRYRRKLHGCIYSAYKSSGTARVVAAPAHSPAIRKCVRRRFLPAARCQRHNVKAFRPDHTPPARRGNSERYRSSTSQSFALVGGSCVGCLGRDHTRLAGVKLLGRTIPPRGRQFRCYRARRRSPSHWAAVYAGTRPRPKVRRTVSHGNCDPTTTSRRRSRNPRLARPCARVDPWLYRHPCRITALCSIRSR